MNEELRHELVSLTYRPEIVSFELTREQGLEILEEIERLKSIIKDVREYIERYLNLNLEAFDTRNLLEKELEILDEVSNNENN